MSRCGSSPTSSSSRSMRTCRPLRRHRRAGPRRADVVRARLRQPRRRVPPDGSARPLRHPRHGRAQQRIFAPSIRDHRGGQQAQWEWMGHNESNTRRLNEAAAGRGAAHHPEHASRPSSGRPAGARSGWLGSGLQETWDTLDLLAAEGCDYVVRLVQRRSALFMTLDGGRSWSPALQPADQRQAGVRAVAPHGGRVPGDDLPASSTCSIARARNPAASWRSRCIPTSPACRTASARSMRRCATSASTSRSGRRPARRSQRHYLAQAGKQRTEEPSAREAHSACEFARCERSLIACAAVAAAPARARRRRSRSGSVGSGLGQPLADLDRPQEGLFRRRGHQARSSSTCSRAPLCAAARGGLARHQLSAGLVDPIHAIDKGAPIAIVRIEMQSPPYALLAKPSIKSIEELKGKTISVDGPRTSRDLCRAHAGAERRQARRVRSGLRRRDLGAPSALQAGAIDAAILLPPFNFYAEAAGFNNLGLTVDYVLDLPFSGAVVNVAWASQQGHVGESAAGAQQKRRLVRGREKSHRSRRR